MKSIRDEEYYSEDIEKIDSITRKNMKIRNFYGNESDELRYDKDFEDKCIALAPNINQPVKTLTTKEFFTLLKMADEKAKRARKK